MQSYNDWNFEENRSKIPMPHEDFDAFFDQFTEADNILNDTLIGLQDLDVPSGYAKEQAKHQQQYGHQAGHSRKISGTAIFGFAEHTRELSINGVTNDFIEKQTDDLRASIVPGDLLKNLDNPNSNEHDYFNGEKPKPLLYTEEEEIRYEMDKERKKQKDEQLYIITNQHPKAYKFPPTNDELLHSEKSHSNERNYDNSYSAKYLQSINHTGQSGKADTVIQDFEPLIDKKSPEHKFQHEPEQTLPAEKKYSKYDEFNEVDSSTPFKRDPIYKFVPIPTQEPIRQAHILSQKREPLEQLPGSSNAFLPPPSPPSLSNGSPNWKSSPEPPSPSPVRYDGNKYQSFVSPQAIPTKTYNTNFYSDNCGFDINSNYLNSIPYEHLSSPVHERSLKSSPIRPMQPFPKNYGQNEDDTIEGNTTIQLSPTTPQRSKVILEWSPVISPNAKSSKDVCMAIQSLSPKRRLNKTSLLPPGELDQYWEGPDENKVFTCIYKNCGKKFTRRYNVRSHIQTHLSDRPFGCSYCPKRFVRQHDLNRHVKGHLEATYCKCICGKEFSRLDALKKHRARNICMGGTSNTSSVSKPAKKKRIEELDPVTSAKLEKDLTSSDTCHPVSLDLLE